MAANSLPQNSFENLASLDQKPNHLMSLSSGKLEEQLNELPTRVKDTRQ